MSPSPSVISRFSTYYATLDTQPPSALAALYHTNALLIDPFGQHQGLSAIQSYLSHLLANVDHCRFTLDAPLCESTFCRRLDHALVASETCRG